MAKGSVAHQAKPVHVEARSGRGSRKAIFLRRTGMTPGIIYGMGKEPLAIAVSTSETLTVLRSGSHILEVSLEGKVEKMLIQDVQYDYLQTNMEHIDLLRIDPHQKVKVKVALEFRGVAKGTKEGGILEVQSPEIEVEVLALSIPDTIRVSIEHLGINDILHAKDVTLPAGAVLIDYPEKILAQVRTIKEEVAATPAEGAATGPEVIGKKKEDEAAAGADAKAAPAKK